METGTINDTRNHADSDQSQNVEDMNAEMNDLRSQVEAIQKSYAVVEYNMDGTVISANRIYLDCIGYSMREIKGLHHSILIDSSQQEDQKYTDFWNNLNKGIPQAGEFRRKDKSGQDVWLDSVYNVVADTDGKPYKVIEYSRDITEARMRSSDHYGQVEAINRSQAVMEFNLDGTIITANDLFLELTGYSLSEVQGQHHSIFVPQEIKTSQTYREFWQQLNAGEFQSGDFKYLTKSGDDLWIRATYNPILDCDSRPMKVVEYASDITANKKLNEGLRWTMAEVEDNSQTLAASAEELSATAQQMTGNCQETAAQANAVAESSSRVSKNVEQVALSVEEMKAAAKEIAQNAAEAARVGTDAVSVAEKTTLTVNRLGESSVQIGNVIKVITSIAQQTNLLALNATIEAARAGEAGKGFAVVANEVKELAKQTATATEDISQKIGSIQAETKAVVDSIRDISDIINQVNDIQNTIATAVEEQTATINGIASNASEGAKGSQAISKNIRSVSEAARSTTEGANNSLNAAHELARLATSLKSIVEVYTKAD